MRGTSALSLDCLEDLTGAVWFPVGGHTDRSLCLIVLLDQLSLPSFQGRQMSNNAGNFG